MFDRQMREEDIKGKKTNRCKCMLVEWVVLNQSAEIYEMADRGAYQILAGFLH